MSQQRGKPKGILRIFLGRGDGRNPGPLYFKYRLILNPKKTLNTRHAAASEGAVAHDCLHQQVASLSYLLGFPRDGLAVPHFYHTLCTSETVPGLVFVAVDLSRACNRIASKTRFPLNNHHVKYSPYYEQPERKPRLCG